jgi:hypothetical protein
MFKGQSQCSVTSSAQHRQEAEVATAEEHERGDGGKGGKAGNGGTDNNKGRSRSSSGRYCSDGDKGGKAGNVRTDNSKGRSRSNSDKALFLPTIIETTSSSWRGRQHGIRRRSGKPLTPGAPWRQA